MIRLLKQFGRKSRAFMVLMFFLDPFSIAFIVLSAASMAMTVIGGIQQQKIAAANARRLRQQAEREQQAANRRAQIEARRRRRERSRATTAFAASGVLVEEGSPLIVEAEDDYMSEINQDTIRAQGADLAHRSRSQAIIENARGRAAFANSIGSSVGQGASLLGTGRSAGFF